MANNINRNDFRKELIEEFNKLPPGKSSPEAKFSSSVRERLPTKFSLDLSALHAEKKIITSLASTIVDTVNTSNTATASTSTSTPPNDRSRKNTALEKNALRLIDSQKIPINSEPIDNSTDSARSPRQVSPRKKEAYPSSSRVRSPSAAEKEKKPASQESSPVTTPRAEIEAEECKSPRSPRAAVNELRKKVSKKFSELDLSKITLSVKNAASSVKESLSASSTPRKQSPRAHSKNELLASISFNARNLNAVKISRLQDKDEFKRKSLFTQAMLMHATLLQDLSEDSPLRSADGLEILLDDAKQRSKNERVDSIVDLNDPSFLNFIKQAAEGAFIKPWGRDSSDVDSALQRYLPQVKNTFARDFSNSSYQVKEPDGSLRALQTIDDFIAFVETDENQELAMVVSNIASQNLGNFLKNALFLRQDVNGVSQSLLKLYDDTPILPQALAKASYILSKDKKGVLTIDYTWESSKAINGDKGIRARELGGNSDTFAIENPALKITCRVSIEPNGEWTIANPHLQAEGWNQTPDR